RLPPSHSFPTRRSSDLPRRRLHGDCHHRVIAKAHEYLAADYADHCPARFPRAEIPWLDSPGEDRQHIGGKPGAKKCPAANACPGHPPWKLLQGSMCPGDKSDSSRYPSLLASIKLQIG